jgi:hypothetical protein
MARGKKPPDWSLEADEDPIAFLELIEVYASGAPVEPGTPILAMTAVTFARLAEGAVYRHRGDLPNGRVGEYQLRAQRLVESALAEECFSSGARFISANASTLAAEERERIDAQLLAHDDLVRRNSAQHCALIMREIRDAIARKGKKGRPSHAPAGSLAALLDAMILRDAAKQVEPNLHSDPEAIAAEIPNVVRTLLRLGQLPWRGETEQQAVDIHAERVRRHMDFVLNNTKDLRGFSIKRRVQ